MPSELLLKNKKISMRLKGNSNALRHGHGSKPKGFSPTYISWQSMLARCRYENRDTEAKYVNRGITVCERWKSFENLSRGHGRTT